MIVLRYKVFHTISDNISLLLALALLYFFLNSLISFVLFKFINCFNIFCFLLNSTISRFLFFYEFHIFFLFFNRINSTFLLNFILFFPFYQIKFSQTEVYQCSLLMIIWQVLIDKKSTEVWIWYLVINWNLALKAYTIIK